MDNKKCMRTKEEILKMSKKELDDYKWDKDLNNKVENSYCSDCSNCSGCAYCSVCSVCSYCSYCSNCSDCSYCFGCSNCSNCSNCSYCSGCSSCSYCRNIEEEQYMICNVQLTKEEYEAKIKELKYD